MMLERTNVAATLFALMMAPLQAKKLPVYNKTDKDLVVNVKGFGTSISRPATVHKLTVAPGKTAELNFKPRNMNGDTYFQSDLDQDVTDFYSLEVFDKEGKLLFQGIPARNTKHVFYSKTGEDGQGNFSSTFEANRPGKILHSNTHDDFNKNLEKGYGIYINPMDDLTAWQDKWRSLMQFKTPPEYPKPFEFSPNQEQHVEMTIQGDGTAVKETAEHVPTSAGGHIRSVVKLEQ